MLIIDNSVPFLLFYLLQLWAVCRVCSWCSNVLCLSEEEVYWLYWNVLPGFHLTLMLFYLILCDLIIHVLFSSNISFFLIIIFILKLVWSIIDIVCYFFRISWQENFLHFLVNCQTLMIGRIIWQQYSLRYRLLRSNWWNFLFLIFHLRNILFFCFRLDWRDTWKWGVQMVGPGGDYVLCQHFGYLPSLIWESFTKPIFAWFSNQQYSSIWNKQVYPKYSLFLHMHKFYLVLDRWYKACIKVIDLGVAWSESLQLSERGSSSIWACIG